MSSKLIVVAATFCIGILLGYASMSQADDTEFRLVVSKNDNIATGRLHIDLEMRIAAGSTTPRTLNSLTIDVTYGSELTAFSTNPDSNWFSLTTPMPGYDLSVSKLTSPSNYYRVIVTGNGIGKSGSGTPPGFSVTNSWQRIVTMRWNIATVNPSYNVSFITTTDCAAYFDNNQNNPTADITEWATATKAIATLRLATKIFLHGPYDTETNLMTNALRSPVEYLPLTSPYDWDKRAVVSIPSTITDWICVQLRSYSNGAVICARSAFLRNDGYVVADDGLTQEISFTSPGGEDSYYFVIRHRNHLAVMSSSAIALSAGSVSTYDFTTALSKFYNSGGKMLETGVYGMYACDGDQNKYINATDLNAVWRPQTGNYGYYTGDFNLSGLVNATDKNAYWRLNTGIVGQVP